MSNLVLLDIDGVLADDTHRVSYALARQWHLYFQPDRVAADTLLLDGKELYECAHASGADVVFLTGRREDLRGTTQAWLDQHGLIGDCLIMKPRFQRIKLPVFKTAVIKELVEDGYGEIRLYDDDPRVVDAVNGMELPGVSASLTHWYVKPFPLVERSKS